MHVGSVASVLVDELGHLQISLGDVVSHVDGLPGDSGRCCRSSFLRRGLRTRGLFDRVRIASTRLSMASSANAAADDKGLTSHRVLCWGTK